MSSGTECGLVMFAVDMQPCSCASCVPASGRVCLCVLPCACIFMCPCLSLRVPVYVRIFVFVSLTTSPCLPSWQVLVVGPQVGEGERKGAELGGDVSAPGYWLDVTGHLGCLMLDRVS